MGFSHQKIQFIINKHENLLTQNVGSRFHQYSGRTSKAFINFDLPNLNNAMLKILLTRYFTIDMSHCIA